MTVRKRLFWSNILMILVPVIATTLIGIFCVAVIVVFLYNGTGLGLNDRERFDYASMAFVELLEKGLETGTDLSAMEKLIDGNGMKVTIMRDGRFVFSYGEEWDNDSDLMAAADSLRADAFIVWDGRSLLVRNERQDSLGSVPAQEEEQPGAETGQPGAEAKQSDGEYMFVWMSDTQAYSGYAPEVYSAMTE